MSSVTGTMERYAAPGTVQATEHNDSLNPWFGTEGQMEIGNQDDG